jgi:hypothetical protein
LEYQVIVTFAVMRFSNSIASLLGFSIFAAAAPQESQRSILPLPTKIVYQFLNDTWIESIKARSNGDLLLSDFITHELYSLNPSSSSPPKLIHTFTGVTNTAGLTEVTPDVFAIITGNLTSNLTAIPKSFSIWVSFSFDSSMSTSHGFAHCVTIIPSMPDTKTKKLP